MFYYLYEIRNLLNGKIYVGVHKTKNLDDGYMGSGRVIRQAIEKNGIENFTRVILETFDNAEAMYARESELVTDEFLMREDVYNLRRGGTGGWDYVHKNGLNCGFRGKKHKARTKKIIGEKSVGRKHNEASLQKMSDNSWTRSNPEAQRSHARKAAHITNSNRTSETLEKISVTVTENWKNVENVECPHCKLHGRGGTMKRWHFDNCKNKAPLDQLE